MCVHSTFSWQVQGSRYGMTGHPLMTFVQVCSMAALRDKAPKKHVPRAGPINQAGEGKLGNSTLSWEITPRREQKVHRENARDREGEGDWNPVIRSSWNWTQSKTSSRLTSPRIIRNSFQLCGKRLFTLSAQMPPWRNSMKWVSGKCQHGSKIQLPMAWLGGDRPGRWGWWNNLLFPKQHHRGKGTLDPGVAE